MQPSLQPSVQLSSAILQRQQTWEFDARSALIGALLAWILAGVLYSQRKAIKQAIQSLWEPFVAWRRRIQASQEEKYVRALKDLLWQRLLFKPKHPELILQEPHFSVPAPLPVTVGEAAQSSRLMTVPYARLLDGHKKVVITGSLGSGRTATLILSVWRATQPPSANDSKRIYARLPFWIDATAFAAARDDEKASSEERVAQMAAATVSGLASKWVLQQLRRESCLIVLDNWDQLQPGDRTQIARWIDEADPQWQDTFWLIASAEEGYADLVDRGFVPAQLLPPTTDIDLTTLLAHWSRLLGKEADPSDEALESLAHAAAARGPLWELHLRAILYLRTQELPDRPVEVLGRILETNLEAVDLGKGQEAIAETARDLALRVIVSIAVAHRLQRNAMSGQQAHDLIESLLPPKEERPRRLDSAVRQLAEQSGVLVEENKQWVPVHPIWADYLTALHLALDEKGEEVIHAHVNDPDWFILSEFYAGLADVEGTVTSMLRQAETYNDHETLLRAARWGIIAEPDRPWRKVLTRSIAETFMKEELDHETRLRMAQTLNLVAGEGARAFFLRMLRHASLDVRRAALRGLGWAGATRDMPILAAALRESKDGLQESAVLALRDAGTPDATAHLAQTLLGASDALMLVIAEALVTTQEGWEALEEAARHPDLMVRRAAAHGLGHVPTDAAREQLLELAREDTEWLVRSAADSALQVKEERNQRLAVVPAPPKIDEMDWLISWAARQGLGLGVGQAAQEMLGRAAREGNVDAKILSSLTLAQVGRESDIRILEPLLGEDDTSVQQAANWAILRIRKRCQVYQGT